MTHPVEPVAPAMDPVPPVAPVPVQPRTYRELLSDETNSPTQERLANFLQAYRFEGGVVPTPSDATGANRDTLL